MAAPYLNENLGEKSLWGAEPGYIGRKKTTFGPIRGSMVSEDLCSLVMTSGIELPREKVDTTLANANLGQ